MSYEEIMSKMPFDEPFRFVDEIIFADADNIVGTYLFRKDLFFYKGHFRDHPVTPGVILTEVMAQIGLVAFGLYLLGLEENARFFAGKELFPVLTSTQMDFYKMVLPGQKVTVRSKKIMFRHGKLKCKVNMEDESLNIVSEGILTGMITKLNHK